MDFNGFLKLIKKKYGQKLVDAAPSIDKGKALICDLDSTIHKRGILFLNEINDNQLQDFVLHPVIPNSDPFLDFIITTSNNKIMLLDIVQNNTLLLTHEVIISDFIENLGYYLETGCKVFLQQLFLHPFLVDSCTTVFDGVMNTLMVHGIENENNLCINLVLQGMVLVYLEELGLIPDAIEFFIKNYDDAIQDAFSREYIVLSKAEWDDTRVKIEIKKLLISIWDDFRHSMNENLICTIMERTRGDKEKRKAGSYYTPLIWAWYTSYRAFEWLEQTDISIKNIKCLDPAVGSGDFIHAFLLVAIDSFIENNYPMVLEKNFNEELGRFKLQSFFPRWVEGYDIDPFAIKLARLRAFLSCAKHARFNQQILTSMKSFMVRYVHGDFLTTKIDEKKYDIVLGNPPYLMEVRSNQEIFRSYKNNDVSNRYYGAKNDVFYFFMEKGLDLLKQNGILAFIVQEYWLDRYHARHIRSRIFSEMAMGEMVLFKNFKVFNDAPGHHSMLFVAKKRELDETDKTRNLIVNEKSISSAQLLRDLISPKHKYHSINEIHSIKLFDKNLDKVFTGGINERQFIDAVRNFPNIHLSRNEIQIGINIPQPYSRKNGEMKGIFVLSKPEIELLNLDENELCLLKPFHPATDLQPYYFSNSHDLFIIYTTNEVKCLMESNSQLYPNIRTHLDRFENEITSDHKPYGLHRPRQPEWFESTMKIIGVRKTKNPKFAHVPIPYFMDQSGIFIKLDESRKINIYYLVAFLNSKLARKLLASMKKQGKQLQVDKSILLKIPIPLLDIHDRDVISKISSYLQILHHFSNEDLGVGFRIDELEQFLLIFIDRLFNARILGKGESDVEKELFKILDVINSLDSVNLEDYIIDSSSIIGSSHPIINFNPLKQKIITFVENFSNLLKNGSK